VPFPIVPNREWRFNRIRHAEHVVTTPHVFNAHPKHPDIPFFVRLHVDIGGRIQENNRQALRLAEDMKHVEAVLKMFDPQFNARAIAARRRVTGNPWFKQGPLFRASSGGYAGRSAPLTVREIADAVLAAKGITDATPKQVEMLQQAVRSSLGNHTGKTVEQVGEGVPKKWKLL
jgi:hypothetical protein